MGAREQNSNANVNGPVRACAVCFLHRELTAPARVLPPFPAARSWGLGVHEAACQGGLKDAEAGGLLNLEFPTRNATGEDNPARTALGLRVPAQHGRRGGRQEQQQQ